MHVIRKGPEGLFGDSLEGTGGVFLSLNQRERDVFLRASRLAARFREAARNLVGEGFDLAGLDMTLAHVEHDGKDLADAKLLHIADETGMMAS